MAVLNCRYFSGYKPCGRYESCTENCPQKDIPQISILIVHLEAMGAVLRATSLLPAIKRKYPSSTITWVTKSPSQALLENLPQVDLVMALSLENLLQLSTRSFDIGFVIDKSQEAFGVVQQTQVDMIYGFMVDRVTGAIVPATPAAEPLWHLGLDNHQKFFVNKKPETQLMAEALELGAYKKDEYQAVLSVSERQKFFERRHQWGQSRGRSGQRLGDKPILGINTGCSPVIQYKKLSVLKHIELIRRIQSSFDVNVVLLGGPQDTIRNQEIGREVDVIQSPTTKGLRDGMVSVSACDLVLSGDSLGMHMGIALKKWVIAWFGPTCDHEIELYGRGVKVLTKANCSPCWKRACNKTPLCGDLVDSSEILSGISEGIDWHKDQLYSSKQPLSEISF